MNLAEKYGIDLSTPGKTACPRCRRRGGDRAGNNLHVYGLGKGAHCWKCEWTIPSIEHMEAMGWDDDEDEVEEVVTREAITQEENERIKSYTSTDGKDWRGIRRETNQFFGVRYEYDEETGEPCKQFVPTTINGELVGYRVRKFPKDFSGGIGQIGKEVDMIGEFRFKNHTKVCVIVGGETKLLNTYQMLKDSQEERGKGDWEIPAVVCSTLGETGAHKQIKSRYAFFKQFEKIIVCMDADDAGREATETICKALPKGRAFVMKMRHKDADDYVEAGQQKEFVQDYWNGTRSPWVPAGIIGSGALSEAMRKEVGTEKMAFPPFMMKATAMTAGGIPLGKIVNIGAGSGIGKTVIVNELIYHWIFHSPHRIGVVSMELNAGQYGIAMLSRHMGIRINNIEGQEAREAFFEREDVKAAERELLYNEDGTHRWHLVDDRDGSVEDLKATVEELVIGCGVKIVVLDPLQDILDGMTIEEQALFLKWQKGLIKSHGITFININHVNKKNNGGGAASNGSQISEEDFTGSSTIFKSAALNILLRRDKMAEDPIERNTTYVSISKNRDNGNTGPADELYWDNIISRLVNKFEWLKSQPQKEF